MNTKRFGALSSSVDPEQFAATASGILKLIGGVVGFFAMTGLINAADGTLLVQNLTNLLTAVTTVITASYAAYGTAQAAFGICRKIAIGLATHFS